MTDRIAYFAVAVFVTFVEMLVRALPLKKKNINSRNVESLVLADSDNENWLRSQVIPIASTGQFIRIHVLTRDLFGIENPAIVRADVARQLEKYLGYNIAKLFGAIRLVRKVRPAVIVGFHLLPNGILAVLLGRLFGIRSVYVACGGPNEFIGGGYLSNNPFFRGLKRPSNRLEKKLRNIIAGADTVIVRGTVGEKVFRAHGVTTNIQIVTAGFDARRFRPMPVEKEFDLIFIGRLVRVKRFEIGIRALKILLDSDNKMRQDGMRQAIVLGEGPERKALESLVSDLNLGEAVQFVGFAKDVAVHLNRSKVIVLTSDNEGMPQVLLQALACGVPFVARKVGDIPDLLSEGEVGIVVDSDKPEEFAQAIRSLLDDESRLQRAQQKAVLISKRFSIESMCEKWAAILEDTA